MGVCIEPCGECTRWAWGAIPQVWTCWPWRRRGSEEKMAETRYSVLSKLFQWQNRNIMEIRQTSAGNHSHCVNWAFFSICRQWCISGIGGGGAQQVSPKRCPTAEHSSSDQQPRSLSQSPPPVCTKVESIFLCRNVVQVQYNYHMLHGAKLRPIVEFVRSVNFKDKKLKLMFQWHCTT